MPILIGIDASNLRGGGGVTHLIELLHSADPLLHGFSKIVVWSGAETLNRIENRPWLEKSHQPLLDKNLIFRSYWQRYILSRKARESGCDVLFVPGGSYAGNFHPAVTMSRNMLPFEKKEFMRFGLSFMTIKMLLLRWSQSRSFRNSEGLIFLTKYAQKSVLKIIKKSSAKLTIVPHGVDERFRRKPSKQFPLDHYSSEKPFRILYVSIVNFYKHQWHMAEAVATLKDMGLPVALELVGPAHAPALKRLKKEMLRLDPESHFIHYAGMIPYCELHKRYAGADMVLFASSCENMPNILLEGMASGLPIACSNRGPMPEMLGSAGIYFDPEKPDEIASAIHNLSKSPELRSRLSLESYERAQAYSWERCAKETFVFLSDIASNYSVSS